MRRDPYLWDRFGSFFQKGGVSLFYLLFVKLALVFQFRIKLCVFTKVLLCGFQFSLALGEGLHGSKVCFAFMLVKGIKQGIGKEGEGEKDKK